MLTVALNKDEPTGCTEATVFGPFFIEGSPAYQQVVFGVRQSLVADWTAQADPSYRLYFDFVLNSAQAGKATA